MALLPTLERAHMWPIDEAASSTAKWITGLIGGLAIAWKIFLRVRRDAREDGAGGAAADGYNLIVDGQRAEITRLHTALSEFAASSNAERAARFKAEEELAFCRRRAEAAEEMAERAARRTAAANEVVELYRAQIKALEDEVERLSTGNGDMP